MLFNSYTFVLFFVVVLASQRLPFPWSFKKGILLASSYLFYAAWNPPFVVLLWISTLIDWWAAKNIFRHPRKQVKRIYFSISLCVNLGLLGYFKYADFLLENFTRFLKLFGLEYHVHSLDVILPVGISFYTFQTLSYTFDIYRGKGTPWHSFLDYALYVAFFPQLVAGPIVRAFDFLPQCKESKRVGTDDMSWGLSLLVLGLFEKMVLADGLLSPIADSVYVVDKSPGFISAWAGTLAFAGQIFCDFAGYSTCAIGVGKCLGFTLTKNFRFPYAAVGFRDFWRRWHISLSTWLRDYLYFSLGGSRKGRIRSQVNVMTTMLVGGLWHGASWTFVVWGGLHGVFILMERLFVYVFGKHSVVLRIIPKPVSSALGGIVTFLLVCIGWVFFRAQSFPQAFHLLKTMGGFDPGKDAFVLSGFDMWVSGCVILSILAAHWIMREGSMKHIWGKTPWVLKSICISFLLTAIVVFSGEEHAFIYFQF